MEVALPAPITSETTLQTWTGAMEQCDLVRELERLHPESWGWALACCRRDPDLAQDVLQTAYLRIVSRRARFNGDSSLRTWVFGVIRWTARGEVRRQLFWNKRHASPALGNHFADPAKDVGAAIDDLDRRARLIDALNGLSRRQREVLQLVFYHDMTIEEAAIVMNVSLGSARTHYERGKKALAQRLGPEADR